MSTFQKMNVTTFEEQHNTMIFRNKHEKRIIKGKRKTREEMNLTAKHKTNEEDTSVFNTVVTYGVQQWCFCCFVRWIWWC